MSELVKLQVQMETKLTDLEGRSRRDNVRLFGVKEGAEDGMASVISFAEDLLMKGLELPPTTTLNIERAHRALAPKPPTEAPPRSIVVKQRREKIERLQTELKQLENIHRKTLNYGTKMEMDRKKN